MNEVKKDVEILSMYERQMKEKGLAEIYLHIEKDISGDVGKSIIRLDEIARRKLSVNIGEKVDIIGPKISTGRVEEAMPQDIGKNVVRIDKKLRKYAMVSIGIHGCIRKSLT